MLYLKTIALFFQCFEMMVDQGDYVIVENPTYVGALMAVRIYVH